VFGRGAPVPEEGPAEWFTGDARRRALDAHGGRRPGLASKGGRDLTRWSEVPVSFANWMVLATSLVILAEGATGAQGNEKGWRTTTDIDDFGDRHRA
jgi:hypothetical protein